MSGLVMCGRIEAAAAGNMRPDGGRVQVGHDADEVRETECLIRAGDAPSGLEDLRMDRFHGFKYTRENYERYKCI